jgi:hypothetical protein
MRDFGARQASFVNDDETDQAETAGSGFAPTHTLATSRDSLGTVFERIDGHRTLGEIADRATHRTASDHARTFFETLWRYDQVVFDASRVAHSR